MLRMPDNALLKKRKMVGVVIGSNVCTRLLSVYRLRRDSGVRASGQVIVRSPHVESAFAQSVRAAAAPYIIRLHVNHYIDTYICILSDTESSSTHSSQPSRLLPLTHTPIYRYPPFTLLISPDTSHTKNTQTNMSADPDHSERKDKVKLEQ